MWMGTITLKTASCKFYSTGIIRNRQRTKLNVGPGSVGISTFVHLFGFFLSHFFFSSLAFPALNGIWMWKPSPLHCVDIFPAACRLITCLSLRCRWGWALECVRRYEWVFFAVFRCLLLRRVFILFFARQFEMPNALVIFPVALIIITRNECVQK